MSKSILIVEDTATHADWESQTIKDSAALAGVDAEIRVVESLEEVRDVIASRIPIWCVVLDMMIFEKKKSNRSSDVTPYFTHGIEALKEVLKLVKPNRILIYTQFPIPEIAKELLVHNLQDRLLVKPAHVKEFDRQVVTMLLGD